MATVEVFTKARMQAIEDEAIVGARIEIVGEQRQLILERNNGQEINAGNVRGAIGLTPVLPSIPDEINWNHGTPLVGIAPAGGPTSVPIRIQSGTTVIETNTVGRAAIFFPALFNGVFSVIAQIGDAVDVICTHYNGGGMIGSPHTIGIGNLNVLVDGYATNAFHVNIYASGGMNDFGMQFSDPVVGGSSPIRINWIAIGW